MKLQHSVLLFNLALLVMSGCSRMESEFERQGRVSILVAEDGGEADEIPAESLQADTNAGGQPGKMILSGLGVLDMKDTTKLNSQIIAIAKAGRSAEGNLMTLVLPENEIELKSPQFVVVQAEDYKAKTYAQVGCKDQVDPAEIAGYTEVVSYGANKGEMEISAEKVFVCNELQYQAVTTHKINSNQLFLKNVTVNWADRNANIQFVTNQLILSGTNELLMNEVSAANDFIAVSQQKMSLSVIEPNGITGTGSLYMEIRGADRIK